MPGFRRIGRISPLGTAIRERAAEGATLAELADELEARFGAPPDGDTEQLTRAAVDVLLEAGLLSSAPASTPPP